MRACIGSTNKAKIYGARKALRIMGIKPEDISWINVDVPNPQPVGFDETFLGASLRALNAWGYLGEGFGVGIEAGIVPIGENFLSGQIAVIVDGEKYSVGTSAFFPVPTKFVEEIFAEHKELGDLMARFSGDTKIRETIGAIGYFTKGLITRADLSFEAVLNALIPWINPELEFKLKPIKQLWEMLKKQKIIH